MALLFVWLEVRAQKRKRVERNKMADNSRTELFALFADQTRTKELYTMPTRECKL